MSGNPAFAEGQLKSIIDRILRLKSEQDDLASDIRGIYTEAKANGFDKTAIGQIVTHLRKREKLGPTESAERDAMFDLYLHAYEGGEPASRTHAREVSA